MRVDFRTEAPGGRTGRKSAPVILSEKELHYVQRAPTEADALRHFFAISILLC